MKFMGGLVIGCLAAAAGQDLQLDGKAAVVQEAGRHVFRVEVATNLPDRAQVEGELFYLVQEPSEENPSVMEWVERPVLGAMSHASVEDGRAMIDLARYTTPPYPLPYRIWLEYDPRIQDPVVRDAAPVVRQTRKSFDFTYGNPVDFKRTVEERKANYHIDYMAIDRLYQNLNQTFMDFWRDANPDRGRWSQWKRSFVAKVEKIKEINDDRMIVMTVSFDWKGHGSIDALCTELLELVGTCNDLLEEKTPDRALPVEAQEPLRRFKRMYDDGFTGMDFDAQADLAKILPALEALRDHVRAVEKVFMSWREGKAVDPVAWEQRKIELQRHIMDQVMVLSSELPKSSMAKRMTDLSADVASLFARCDQAFAGPDRSGAEELSVLVGAIGGRIDDIKRVLISGEQR